MKNKKKQKKKHVGIKVGGAALFLAGAAVFLERLAKATEEQESINDGNPYLEGAVSEWDNADVLMQEQDEPTLYERFGKRALDKVLSFFGLVALAPLFGLIAVAIEIDDPGPVLFKQKRVGKDKTFFELHKFRSMKMSTPHDVPTHQLSDPDQYITRVGKLLRKTSLDELPQIWDIFRGKMSIIGPRPALWNQEDLIAERDKYGANGIMPGLTGLAQINGRDELEICDKAALDGEYVKALRESSTGAFLADVKCFIGTIKSVASEDGVVEGGTGELKKNQEAGAKDPFDHDTLPARSKRILITGADSYIGGSLKHYLEQWPEYYKIDVLDTMGLVVTPEPFKGYDVVFNLAGIAHVKETDENRHLYYEVNRDLSVAIAKAAKEAGVSQLILLSTMSVYGLTTGYITKDTVPNPVNAYGESKYQADMEIRKLADEQFRFACLRPPMVYGRGCKGNYQTLRSFALQTPVFPDIDNKRSMIYIGNLCEFIKRIIDTERQGLFFPQNAEYVNTTDMVRRIAAINGNKIVMTRAFNWALKRIPVNIVNKVFGDLTYEKVDLVSKYGFDESIELTELGSNVDR